MATKGAEQQAQEQIINSTQPDAQIAPNTTTNSNNESANNPIAAESTNPIDPADTNGNEISTSPTVNDALPPQAPPAPQEPDAETVRMKSMPVREYLECTVVPLLLQSLQKLVLDRPKDPVGYLVEFLTQNNPTRLKLEEKAAADAMAKDSAPTADVSSSNPPAADASPVPATEAAPAPAADASPVPAADASPVPAAEAAPAPQP